MITLLASIFLGVAYFFSIKFLIARINQNTTSEAETQIPEVIKEITTVDETIQKALEYANELVPFDQALERREKESILQEELKKQLTAISKLEGNLNELKFEVEETEREYNEIKKGKEEAEDVTKNIKSQKSNLESENETLQKNLTNILEALKTFSQTKKLDANQDAGFKIILSNINTANKQLETLVMSYKQSSARFLNLHEQFNDLEVEFSRLVEQELSD